MNTLTEFEKPLYTKVPEHPGVWKPHLYRPMPIRSAMDSSDPHLLDGYSFNHIYLQTPSEFPAWKQSNTEGYGDFVLRLNSQYNSIYRQYFEGQDLGIPTLQQDQIDLRNTTYRRHYCQSARNLDSIDIKRMKIRAQKQNVPIPNGWQFKPTTSANAHRSWEELAALNRAAHEMNHTYE
ncbi:uncharacterized protein LOC131677758 [Topomyia yanbarensis]|uniref:uncharacterized protein LOC131677758 n=1 Tax=Topomyia yanbarensis TaxID=2498891 RepID=UPI00273C86DD|nr:uncharacterized protein LOC131677758 [Topomyia yanbarensis]